MQTQTTPSIQLPAQLSTLAPQVDWLYDFIFYVSLVFFFGIVAAMVYFMVKYRRRPGVKAEPTGHHNALELFWTFSPLILLFMMFHWGFQTYISASVAPDDALNIRVRASQWIWAFEHPNGVTETGEVHVPAGRPVRMILSSEDVLHSFYVPDFRVKRDAVPGMFTSLWFQAIEPEGVEPNEEHILYDSQVFCTEYCGTSHSAMLATLHVMRGHDYDQFLAVGPTCPHGTGPDGSCNETELVAWGQENFQRIGCTTCHSAAQGGPNAPGPNLWGIAGTQVELEGGTSVLADADYLEQSIRQPQAQIVHGFTGVQMSHFSLGAAQIDSLVAYIQSLH
ncbi:MAG: cytochrome c oxidase subunit II [Sandaracinus sp.]